MSGYSRSGFDVTPLSEEQVAELAGKLAPDEARIILGKGTEPAFCGNLLDNHKDGVYVCKLCGLPLFSSDAKFTSGTGWPSFFAPYDPMHVAMLQDNSHGMQRIEILCNRCGAHLGHVFPDGPAPTGLRFCLNSASLEFYEKGAERPASSTPVERATAYFAGGCFWGVEDRFQQTPGVIDAVSGYMGGNVPNMTSKIAYASDTGHAETVRVDYDPNVISYEQLLERYFKYHDPTTLNRQGPDVGPLYRSEIFAVTPEQKRQALDYIEKLQKTDRFKGRKIVTLVEEASEFWPAEEYHQDYHAKHGGHCPLPPE
ncbi:MAG: bifunctional methionine sulfoxide reductase B/A protein [Phycisphaeraceae bacterium]|nr:bifunctional methionine sulfoxide reductase B/A protein [Phycisphaeraceae bacterium]